MTRLLPPVLAVVLCCFCVPSGQADTPAPFPKIEAKRVKPPKPGTRKRITVQIQTPVPKPKPPVAPTDPMPEDTVVVARPSVESPGRYADFWDRISPELTASGPGRLDDAMRALGATNTVAAPRLQALQEIARQQARPILTSTVGTQVSPALVLAVIAVESSGNPKAQSHAGAQGLMQLMPATADRFGVSDSFAPDQNIAGGVRYLDWLMQRFDRDPILVLAGYNAGEGSVDDHHGVPPFAETRDYVPKVLAAFQVARGLCKTPPELISDGCVFVGVN